LFGEVLTLCAKAGLAKVGVIAVDGRKVHANASRDENLDYEQLAGEILEEAKAVDAAEDELYGDELPEQLRTGEGRRAWLRKPSSSSTSSANAKRGRCRGHGRSASRKPSTVSTRSSGPKRERTLRFSHPSLRVRSSS
jgi:hypothetical protein